MPRAYDSLAEWFEYLNDDCGYPRWSQYFIEGLSALHAGKCGLELGCGSGAFCRALTENGYTMTGADISAPMLSEAARRSAGRIEYLLLDARSLKTNRKFDFILAPNDCYNYLAPEELPHAFARAAACLKKNGVFWFDVSSPCKLRGKVADNIFADDRDDVTYLCFSRLLGDRVEMDVTLFVKEADGRFSRRDELHTQYIHEEGEIASALAGAGFTVLRVEGHLGEAKEGSDRLNFICRKA